MFYKFNQAGMTFHWNEENREHHARHNVLPSQADGAFGSDDALLYQDAARLKPWMVEATVEGRTLKVAFASVFPEGYRVITAHWMRSRRRRKA